MSKYINTKVTYINNNNEMLLFYSIILVKLLIYDRASIYRRITYDFINKDNKAINN